MSIQSIVRSLIKSLGLKRKLANLLTLVATIATTVPVLAPYAALVGTIGSWLGITGVAHAAVAKTFKVDIHTVAAFFAALVTAAAEVPILQPYAPLIQAIASVLSFLASAAWLGGQ